MIDRIFMFIHFFNSEYGFEFLTTNVLEIQKASKNLLFKFDIENRKSFILRYDDFYNRLGEESKLGYVELKNNYDYSQITRSKKWKIK